MPFGSLQTACDPDNDVIVTQFRAVNSQGGAQFPTGGIARERPFESQVSADQV
jgi:hypothetical protein